MKLHLSVVKLHNNLHKLIKPCSVDEASLLEKHELERKSEGLREKKLNGFSNHANFGLSSLHESLYPAGLPVKPFPIEAEKAVLTLVREQDKVKEIVTIKKPVLTRETKPRNPNLACLAKFRNGKVYIRLDNRELWLLCSREADKVWIRLTGKVLEVFTALYLNSKYDFEKQIPSQFWLTRNLKVHVFNQRKIFSRVSRENNGLSSNYNYNNSIKPPIKAEPRKPKPTIEVHGTPNKCCLCNAKPTVKTLTETTGEHDRPIHIINYFCPLHWKREKPKHLFTKAHRINHQTRHKHRPKNGKEVSQAYE